jgi:hypothetical protein
MGGGTAYGVGKASRRTCFRNGGASMSCQVSTASLVRPLSSAIGGNAKRELGQDFCDPPLPRPKCDDHAEPRSFAHAVPRVETRTSRARTLPGCLPSSSTAYETSQTPRLPTHAKCETTGSNYRRVFPARKVRLPQALPTLRLSLLPSNLVADGKVSAAARKCTRVHENFRRAVGRANVPEPLRRVPPALRLSSIPAFPVPINKAWDLPTVCLSDRPTTCASSPAQSGCPRPLAALLLRTASLYPWSVFRAAHLRPGLLHSPDFRRAGRSPSRKHSAERPSQERSARARLAASAATASSRSSAHWRGASKASLRLSVRSPFVPTLTALRSFLYAPHAQYSSPTLSDRPTTCASPPHTRTARLPSPCGLPADGAAAACAAAGAGSTTCRPAPHADWGLFVCFSGGLGGVFEVF